MSVPSHQLVRWVAKCLSGLVRDEEETVVVNERGFVTRFELWHVETGERGHRLHRISVEEGANAEKVAQELADSAEYDASTRFGGRVERYLAEAYIGNDPEPDTACPFVVRARSLHEVRGSDNDTEPPTEKGFLGQLMRHLERKDVMMAQMVEVTTGRLIRDLETERDTRVRLETALAQLREAEQSLLDRRMEREIEQATALQRAKRKDELIGTVMTLLPAAVARATERDTPVEVQAENLAVRKFLKLLTQDEITAIFTALSPEKRQMLAQVYSSCARQDAGEQAEKPPILRDE